MKEWFKKSPVKLVASVQKEGGGGRDHYHYVSNVFMCVLYVILFKVNAW